MAKNLDNLSPHYEELKGLAGADLVAGDLLTSEDTHLFPLINVLDTDDYAGIVKSPKVLAKKAVGAITFGDLIYWKTATKDVGISGDILIGYAIESALSGDTHISISFDGTLDASVASINAEPKILVAKITADASGAIAVAGLKEGDEIIGAHVICTVANANGTLILETGGDDDITDGIICAVDKVVVPAGTIDDAFSTLPASGAQIISVGGTAANTRGIMVITYIPVAV